MSRRTPAPAPALPRDIRDMLMYRVARLATLGDRTGQLRISREFGLNVGDWRALGAIHALAPATLATLARELYLDKGQLSRTISGLIEQGLVSHRANASDRRQALFETTAEGRRLHDRVLAFVAVRNADLLGALSDREQAQFFRLLDKVTATSERSYEDLFGAPTRVTSEREQSSARRQLKKTAEMTRATGA